MYFKNKLVHLQSKVGSQARSKWLPPYCNTMSNQISHSGIIDSISDGVAHVRIVQSSACSSCKVASYCSSAESKEKMIDVRCPDASRYSVGQAVTVMAAQAVGMKAVVLAFIIPTILLLAVIIACVGNGVSDGIAAMAGITVLVPYYFLLYLSRNRLENILTFYLK